MSADTPADILSQPRNGLTSKWDMLFEKNPKEWMAFKPALGLQVYPCYSCRHMFHSKKSFQYHMNRRAVVLRYKCPGCSGQDLTFYNRCALLVHTRKHYNLHEGSLDLNNLEVEMLPLGLAGFTKCSDIPYLFDVDEEYITNGQFLNSLFYAPADGDRGKSVVGLTPTNLVINKTGPDGEVQALSLLQVARNIPKCEFVTVDHLNRLRRHVVVSDEEVEVKTEDEELEHEFNSNMILPVITKIETVEESASDSPETALYKCPECFREQNEPLLDHFLGENRPMDEKLKCEVCRLICTSPCSYSAHLRIHDQIPPYVCPDCGQEFPEFNTLHDHMDDTCFHLSKSLRYRCPGRKCGKLFATMQTYSQHFNTHMKNLFQCGGCHALSTSAAEAQEHGRTHSEAYEVLPCYDCSICDLGSHLNRAGCRKHIEWHMNDLSKVMYIYLCKYCKKYFRSTQTYGTHLIQCAIEHKGVPKKTRMGHSFMYSKYLSGECKRCQKRIIYAANAPTRYCGRCLALLRKGNEEQKVVEKCICILCKMHMPIADRKSHQKVCKYGRPEVLVERLDFSNLDSDDSATTTTTTTATPDTATTTSSPTKTKRRKISKPKKPEVVCDLTAEKPIEFNGIYQCRLCYVKDKDRERFHAHVKGHRQESTAYQCMECGECFVVRPSLIIHLLHYHNISEYEQYFDENDCFDKSAVNELAKNVKMPHYMKGEVNENQCRVCRDQFRTKDEHDKHFRVHGMAFLLKNSAVD
ncbi:zinc finger protein 687a-like [Cylas formicarius]|uniref:zinc finger protein 687a-like n=1 Tax=Cylas formicarius TaxID=197179 RepID=UPI002958633A|nr:zinc finger protein 687a-like [Cylas formicarius]